MKLVEQIVIKKSHSYFKEIDNLCFLSKNLYNQALYKVKNEYENTGKYLNYYDLVKQLSIEKQIDYCALPAKVSQQTLMLLDRNFKSFFASLKDYKSNPSKYNGQPRIPKFLHKTKGRFILTYTEQAISKKALNNSILSLSKTNISIKTNHKEINQVRIVPKINSYVIEIVYEKKEKESIINDNIVGIDLGLNNLATIACNNSTNHLIINGKPLKSINQYYNKKKALLQAKLPHFKDKENKLIQKTTSKGIQKLTCKRNNKIKDYMHKASREVVKHLQQNNISKVVIGHNKDWKQSINIGKSNNQKFVAIPHANFINMIEYKAKLEGIEVVTREESYTSKCSFLDNETIRKHEIYKGRRVKRGLFKSANGTKWSADMNGSCNILKKEVPNAFNGYGIEGVLVHPRKLSF